MEPISLNHRRLRGPILRLQSDERLSRLAAGGDQAAFEVLVRRHRSALVRACGRILPGDQAEDAVQQAFLSAHQALLRNGAPERFEPWLHRIGVNAALKELRGVAEELPLDEERVDGVEQPPDRLERRERLHSTLAAIGALPERQRRALVLRELEGRGHEEIARDLGLTKGAVRQLIHRARTSVRSAATALTPYGLLLRLEGTSDGSARAAEALVGGGAATFAGKTLVAAVLAGGIASGIATLPQEGRPPANAAGGGGGGAAAGSGSDVDDPSSRPGGSEDSSGHGGRDHDDDRERDKGDSHHGSGSGHGPGEGGSGASDDDDEPDGDEDEDGHGSGSGSGSSHSGSSGSGSSGSGSSGSGSSGSGSSGSGSSGSSGSGSGEPEEPEEPDDD